MSYQTFEEGVLVYDENSKRMDIRFGIEEYYGGLHCGECFDVKIENEWIPVRIESGDAGWYLCNEDSPRVLASLRGKDNLTGLIVRK